VKSWTIHDVDQQAIVFHSGIEPSSQGVGRSTPIAMTTIEVTDNHVALGQTVHEKQKSLPTDVGLNIHPTQSKHLFPIHVTN